MSDCSNVSSDIWPTHEVGSTGENRVLTKVFWLRPVKTRSIACDELRVLFVEPWVQACVTARLKHRQLIRAQRLRPAIILISSFGLLSPLISGAPRDNQQGYMSRNVTRNTVHVVFLACPSAGFNVSSCQFCQWIGLYVAHRRSSSPFNALVPSQRHTAISVRQISSVGSRKFMLIQHLTF
jgi:hypothetical protein